MNRVNKNYLIFFISVMVLVVIVAMKYNPAGYPPASTCMPLDLYLYYTEATPSLTAAVEVGDRTLDVDSVTSVDIGDVITIYEDDHIFQSLVMGISTLTIAVGSPIDYAFTTDAVCDIGLWSMNVDGSSTPVTFSIKSPPNIDFCIHTIGISILDASAMDDGTFGGRPVLANGIYFSREYQGIYKNLALIVNNLGFREIGFTTSYSAKAPAGQYGFSATRDIDDVNGIVLVLSHSAQDTFSVTIQDDLTVLDTFACVCNGHEKQ